MSNETAIPPNFEDARVRGSIRPWQVASAYVIKYGHLVAAGDQAGTKTYFPFAFPEILGEFTKLAVGSDSDVVDFALRWGALGFSGVQGQGSTGETIEGDPIDWILEHAKQVTKIINLIDHRLQGSHGSLLESLNEFIVEPKRNNFFVFEFALITGGNRRVLQTFTEIGDGFHLVPPDQIPSLLNADASPLGVNLLNIDLASAPSEFRSDKGKYRLLADIIIQEVINRNIDYMPMKLVMPVFGQLVRSYVFNCLLTAIYSFLAGAALGEFEYVKCAYCDDIFRRTSKRQYYCPPEFGSSASLCSVRQRKLNQRNKKQKRLTD